MAETVRITWTDSTGAGVTGHKIYRDDVEIGDVGVGVETFDDTTAVIDATYKYEVQAYDGGGETTTETLTVNTDNITIVDPDDYVYTFDGDSDAYFELDQSTMIDGLVAQSWVIEAKVTGDNTNPKGLVGATINGALQIEIETDDLIDCRLNDTGTSTMNNSSWSQDELWHIFVLTYDTTNGFELFEDDTSQDTNADLEFTARTAGRTVVLGRANGFNFIGSIRTIQLYNKVLSGTEITNLQTDITNTATGLIANFAQQKTSTTWTSEVGSFTATNQNGVIRETI